MGFSIRGSTLFFFVVFVSFTVAQPSDGCWTVVIRETLKCGEASDMDCFLQSGDGELTSASSTIGYEEQSVYELMTSAVMTDQSFWWRMCLSHGALEGSPKWKFKPFSTNTTTLQYRSACRGCNPDDEGDAGCSGEFPDSWVCSDFEAETVNVDTDPLWIVDVDVGTDFDDEDVGDADLSVFPELRDIVGSPFGGQMINIGKDGITVSETNAYPNPAFVYLYSWANGRPDGIPFSGATGDQFDDFTGKSLSSFDVIPVVTEADWQLRRASDSSFRWHHAFFKQLGPLVSTNYPANANQISSTMPVSARGLLSSGTDVNWFDLGVVYSKVNYQLDIRSFWPDVNPPSWVVRGKTYISAWTYAPRNTRIVSRIAPGQAAINVSSYDFRAPLGQRLLIRVGPYTSALQLPWSGSTKRDAEEVEVVENVEITGIETGQTQKAEDGPWPFYYGFTITNNWCDLPIPLDWIKAESQSCNGQPASCTLSGSKWRDCTCPPGYWANGKSLYRNTNYKYPEITTAGYHINTCTSEDCPDVIRIPGRSNRWRDYLTDLKGDPEVDELPFTCDPIDYCAVYGPIVGESVASCETFSVFKKIVCANGYVSDVNTLQLPGDLVWPASNCYNPNGDKTL
jgi:hypothetical protein